MFEDAEALEDVEAEALEDAEADALEDADSLAEADSEADSEDFDSGCTDWAQALSVTAAPAPAASRAARRVTMEETGKGLFIIASR